MLYKEHNILEWTLILVLEEKIDHMSYLTMDPENLSLKLIITDIHIVLNKKSHMQIKLKKAGKEVMYYFKCFNSNYMEFVSYETCDKLIWTSG